MMMRAQALFHLIILYLLNQEHMLSTCIYLWMKTVNKLDFITF